MTSVDNQVTRDRMKQESIKSCRTRCATVWFGGEQT